MPKTQRQTHSEQLCECNKRADLSLFRTDLSPLLFLSHSMRSYTTTYLNEYNNSSEYCVLTQKVKQVNKQFN